MRAVAVVCSLVAAALPAAAQEASFWESTIDPTVAQVQPLLEGVRAGLAGSQDRASLEAALGLANRALAIRPGDPAVRRLRGRVLYALERWAEAARDLEEAARLDPEGPLAADATFDLGVALTRLGRAEGAAAAYERFLDECPIAFERAIALTNLGETLMGLGRLEEAAARFREAAATDPRYPHAPLGLAVALDRQGDSAGAEQAMLRALGTGAGIASLDVPGVFFVPPWEIHYYRALAHEVLGQTDEARSEWTAFLDQGGERGPFARRAREHLAALPLPETD